MKKIFIVILIIGALFIWLAHSLFNPGSVDTDCLLDLMEQANVSEISETFGMGYIDENWTLYAIDLFYRNKYPKSRWMVKTAMNYYFNKCEK